MSRDISQGRSGKFIVGIFMGVALVVPGVSAGTVALVLGVHRQLLQDIVKTRAGELFPIGIGVLLGAGGGIRAVWWALDAAPEITLAFFMGLLGVAIGDFIWVNRPGRSCIMWVFVGVMLALLMATAGVHVVKGPPGGWMTMLPAGAVSSGAMLFPGLSGGTLLLVFGLYGEVIGAFSVLYWPAVLWFLLGACLGLFAAAYILRWALSRWENQLIALLTGLMVGSMRSLIPAVLSGGVVLSAVAGGVIGWALSRFGDVSGSNNDDDREAVLSE